MKEFKRFLLEEDGMGVVEVILIVVVLISLVALFKTQITDLVTTVLKKVTTNAKNLNTEKEECLEVLPYSWHWF